MGFLSSSSSSKDNTLQGASLSGGTNGGAQTLGDGDITITQSDHGSIAVAAGMAQTALEAGTLASTRATDAAVSLAQINDNTVTNALNSAAYTAAASGEVMSEAIQSNADVTRDAIDQATSAARDAAESAASAAREASRTASDALASALGFAGNQNENMFDFADGSLDRYESLFSRAAAMVTDAQVTSAAATDGAMEYMFESSKGADERVAESTTKYAMFAVAGMGVLMLLGGRR